jgi:uncharacterized membrane protein
LKFRRFGAAAGKNIAVCRCNRLLDLTDVIIFRELGRCFCWNFTLHLHRSEDDALKQYVAIGLGVLAGAVLLEAALVPGLVIGGAAVLAPKVLPALRRRMQSARDGMDRRRAAPAAPQPKQADDVDEAAGVLARFGIGQAVAKTITFRVIVTTLDFTTNYVVIGELTTAAGLSTFNLIAGPLFYLAHESGWNYFGGTADTPINVMDLLPGRRDTADEPGRRDGLMISRALAKTVTFRTLATAMDFTTNYVVVGDVATAVILSASGFILGPFVYFGHEWLWDRYGAPKERAEAAPPLLEWRSADEVPA